MADGTPLLLETHLRTIFLLEAPLRATFLLETLRRNIKIKEASGTLLEAHAHVEGWFSLCAPKRTRLHVAYRQRHLYRNDFDTAAQANSTD